MSKNHMTEVAKLLGVELGEIFEIADGCLWEKYYRFTNNGVEASSDKIHWKKCISEVLEWLVKGGISIEQVEKNEQ